ncbi:hypothetical protein JD969_07530 [Planctomycetota bacterium]|nr:hypothetical protein JD969_07530 [Planctomycetota bacterium]
MKFPRPLILFTLTSLTLIACSAEPQPTTSPTTESLNQSPPIIASTATQSQTLNTTNKQTAEKQHFIDVTKPDDSRSPYVPLTSQQQADLQKLATKHAQRDITHANLQLHPFGKRASSARIYDQLLLNRYHIRNSHVVSPTETNITYAAAYNKVMRDHIKHLFGPTVFKDTHKEATTLDLIAKTDRIIENNITPMPTKAKQLLQQFIKKQAEQDLTKNHYEYRLIGQPRANEEQFERIMRDKYDTKVIRLAGCRVTNAIHIAADDYNAIMLPALEKVYGKTFLNDAWLQADALSILENTKHSE